MDLKSALASKTPSQIALEVQNGARFVVYQYCVSLLIVTFRRSSPPQFVPAGESPAKVGLRWTLLTALVGWWGFPFGLIWTPVAIYKNLNGGIDVTRQILASLPGAVVTQSL
jgi:hypothetical protein